MVARRSRAIAPAELRRVRRRFLRRGAEVDRKERRGEVEQLVPGLVDLRGKVVALGIGLPVAELGVVGQVPARELRRGDARRHGVQQAQEPVAARMGAVEDGVVERVVQQHREVEHGPARDERRRDPDPGLREVPGDRRGREQHQELPRRDRHVPGRALAVQLFQQVVRDLAVQAVAQVLGRLGPVVLAGRQVVRTGQGGGGWGGAHGWLAPRKTPGRTPVFSHSRARGPAAPSGSPLLGCSPWKLPARCSEPSIAPRSPARTRKPPWPARWHNPPSRGRLRRPARSASLRPARRRRGWPGARGPSRRTGRSSSCRGGIRPRGFQSAGSFLPRTPSRMPPACARLGPPSASSAPSARAT